MLKGDATVACSVLFLPCTVIELSCFTLKLPLILSLLSDDSFKYNLFYLLLVQPQQKACFLVVKSCIRWKLIG